MLYSNEVSPCNRVSLPAIKAGGARPSPCSTAPFPYERLRRHDLSQAPAWTPKRGGMCGSEANAIIVAAYRQLDERFQVYLGTPRLSNWLTFGKYSAREVGRWIGVLEDVWSLLHRLGDKKTSVGEKLSAARALMKLVLSSAVAEPALRAMWRATRGGAGGKNVQPPRRRSSKMRWVRALLSAPRLVSSALMAVRSALVKGNTELYSRMAFAFDRFLYAESKGESGVVALAEQIRAGRLEDGSGYLLGAFAKYRLARTVGFAMSAPGISEAERESLAARRRALIFDANLMLAVQEQSLVLQKQTIFGDPLVDEVLGGVAPGDLALTLPGEKGGPARRFAMLPDGGNWADFAARMGFQSAPAGSAEGQRVYNVIFPSNPGVVVRYVADHERRGTILDLLTRYFDGPLGELLMDGYPAPSDAARA